jgi:peptide/nickel transport system ATP-binding protein
VRSAGRSHSGRAEAPLLQVRQLRTWFPSGGRWFGKRRWIRAVDGVDLDVARGEVLGIVGESGSGKTTLGRSVLRLVEPTGGSLRPLRRRMQIVFQDPYGSLSPRMQIRRILAEPLRLHGLIRRGQEEAKVSELLRKVGLEPYFMHRYPHEMSGGQRQRIAIARAIGLEPDLLVADEPVSALDVSVQAQVLALLAALQGREGIAMLFISHDLSVVERVADRIAVMYRGKIVEEGPAEGIIRSPLHPYTQALLSSVPDPDSGRRRERIRLRGDPPPATGSAVGCPFVARCPEVRELCRRETPPLEPKREGALAACHFR